MRSSTVKVDIGVISRILDTIKADSNNSFIIFSVFISHVIKTKNRNRSINKFKNLGYNR